MGHHPPAPRPARAVHRGEPHRRADPRRHPYPGAVEAVRRWHEQGHFVHVTSHRALDRRDATAAWLQRIGLPFDDLHCSFDKVSRCVELEIDLLIDDGPENLSAALEQGIARRHDRTPLESGRLRGRGDRLRAGLDRARATARAIAGQAGHGGRGGEVAPYGDVLSLERRAGAARSTTCAGATRLRGPAVPTASISPSSRTGRAARGLRARGRRPARCAPLRRVALRAERSRRARPRASSRRCAPVRQPARARPDRPEPGRPRLHAAALLLSAARAEGAGGRELLDSIGPGGSGDRAGRPGGTG